MTTKKQENLLKKIIAYELQRNVVDYEMAASLHELRALVKSDMDFIILVSSHYQIHSKTLRMWLRTARFYPKFTKKQWRVYGGRESIQKLAYLNSVQRKKVMLEADRKLEKRRRPLTSVTMQNIINSFGFKTKTPGQGRMKQTEVERKLLLCQNWLDTIYKNYTNLPRPPKEVKDAMKRTALAQAMRKLAAS